MGIDGIGPWDGAHRLSSPSNDLKSAVYTGLALGSTGSKGGENTPWNVRLGHAAIVLDSHRRAYTASKVHHPHVGDLREASGSLHESSKHDLTCALCFPQRVTISGLCLAHCLSCVPTAFCPWAKEVMFAFPI